MYTIVKVKESNVGEMMGWWSYDVFDGVVMRLAHHEPSLKL